MLAVGAESRPREVPHVLKRASISPSALSASSRGGSFRYPGREDKDFVHHLDDKLLAQDRERQKGHPTCYRLILLLLQTGKGSILYGAARRRVAGEPLGGSLTMPVGQIRRSGRLLPAGRLVTRIGETRARASVAVNAACHGSSRDSRFVLRSIGIRRLGFCSSGVWA
jgi:hypothetical protein